MDSSKNLETSNLEVIFEDDLWKECPKRIYSQILIFLFVFSKIKIPSLLPFYQFVPSWYFKISCYSCYLIGPVSQICHCSLAIKLEIITFKSHLKHIMYIYPLQLNKGVKVCCLFILFHHTQVMYIGLVTGLASTENTLISVKLD